MSYRRGGDVFSERDGSVCYDEHRDLSYVRRNTSSTRGGGRYAGGGSGWDDLAEETPHRGAFHQAAYRDQEPQLAKLTRSQRGFAGYRHPSRSSFDYSVEPRPGATYCSHDEGSYYVENHRGGVDAYPYSDTGGTSSYRDKYNNGDADLPSMILSDSSNDDIPPDDDQWNEKIPASSKMYTYNPHRSLDTNQRDGYDDCRKPAPLQSKLSFRKDEKPRAIPPKMIEVSPGHFVRLRGADDTWKAILTGFYRPCECVCCEIELFCIEDAWVVLCPDCRVVSPLEGATNNSDGGVGLGFKIEDLAKWLEDLERTGIKH